MTAKAINFKSMKSVNFKASPMKKLLLALLFPGIAFAGVQNWSTTPASNANPESGINFATGSAPSTVHPSLRQTLADVATWYASAEWLAQADVPTYSSATVFTVTTNRTGVYSVGRRVSATGSGYTVYGSITSSVYTSVTTVTVAWDSGSIDATVSAVAVGILQNQLAHFSPIGLTVLAPSFGTALTVNGLAGQSAINAVTPPNAGSYNFTDGTNSGSIYTNGTSGTSITSLYPLAMYVNGATRQVISQAGNFTINSPSSGTALTINGLGGASTLLVGGGNSGPTGGTNTFAVRATGTYGGGFAIEDTGTPAYWGLYSNSGTLNFGVNTSSTTGALTSKLSITSAGNVTISPSSGTALAMPTPATVTTVNSASFTNSSASSAGTVGFNSTSASSGSGISNSSGTITLANAGWYLVSFSGTTANSGTNQQINVYLAPSGCTVIGPTSSSPVAVYTAASNGANFGYVGFTALVHSTASNQTFTVQTSLQGMNTNTVLTVVQIG